MKKLLSISMLAVTLLLTATFAEAAPTTKSEPQLWAGNQPRRVQQNTRWNRRGARVVTQTRIVRVGRQRFRETVQIRYQPNGRTTTRVISRVRIR